MVSLMMTLGTHYPWGHISSLIHKFIPFSSWASITWLNSWHTRRGLPHTTKSVFNKACYCVLWEILNSTASPYGCCFARMHLLLRDWSPGWGWHSVSQFFMPLQFDSHHVDWRSSPVLHIGVQRKGSGWRFHFSSFGISWKCATGHSLKLVPLMTIQDLVYQWQSVSQVKECYEALA